jgi:hypothetical protein
VERVRGLTKISDVCAEREGGPYLRHKTEGHGTQEGYWPWVYEPEAKWVDKESAGESLKKGGKDCMEPDERPDSWGILYPIG